MSVILVSFIVIAVGFALSLQPITEGIVAKFGALRRGVGLVQIISTSLEDLTKTVLRNT